MHSETTGTSIVSESLLKTKSRLIPKRALDGVTIMLFYLLTYQC